jgi:DNA-binding transcriptional MerR regulator
MMSISDFSEMCHLTPQALRFYHAEGLLVPAEVDERTGHRGYAFEQVEQAMLITLLRDAGMSVKQVREALAEPDRRVALLSRHAEQVRRDRAAQDEALQAAEALFSTRPQAFRRAVPARTVVARVVEGTPPGRNADEWATAEAMIAVAADDLVKTVGGTGLPWRVLALETPEQDRGVRDGEGPFWMVKVEADVTDVPDGFTVRREEACEEWAVFMPGRNTMAKYCTVVLRLMDTMPLLDGDDFVNLAKLRQEVREDGVLSSAPIERRPPEFFDR